MAALCGLASVLLVFLGSAVIARTSGPGRHSLHASTDEVAAYLADASLGRVWAGEYVGVLGFLLFVPFAAYLWSVTRGAADSDWLGVTARGAAWVYVALSIAGVAALAPALGRELEPVQAAAFLDLRSTIVALAFVAFAGWLVAAGAQALRTGTLPAWLGWAAVAVGVLQAVATPFTAYLFELTGLPTLAGFLWVAIVSVLLARRRPARSAPGPA